MEQQEEEVRTTVVLHEIDVAILRQVEKDFGVSRSAAVRILIRKAGVDPESPQNGNSHTNEPRC